jgi:beta-lactamase class A
VDRLTFLAGTLALGAAGRTNAASLHGQIVRAAGSSSGTVGAWARSMGPAPALVALNADVVFPTASVIKLLILVALFQRVDRDPALLARTVALRAPDLVGGSEFLARAQAGDRVAIGALARAMIAQSDNAASNTLITLLGFEAINATARRAGLRHTHLRRHFLDYSAIVRHNENLSTPRDIGTLLHQIERGAREGLHTVASPLACRHMIDILLRQEDRTKIAAGLPHGVPLANKTGEISGVRSDAGIVDPYGDGPYVLAVLTKELNNTTSGERAIATIAHAVDKVLGAGR